MSASIVPFWKEAPFVRLLIPFIAGIIIQYHFHPAETATWTLLVISFAGVILYSLAPLKTRFRNAWIHGCNLNVILLSTAVLITRYNDPFAPAIIVEKFCKGSSLFIASLQEPPSEKPASWKAQALLLSIQNNKEVVDPHSNILLYFRKDSTLVNPGFGDRIAFIKSPDKIKNFSAQPGFDYKRYCALKNIHYQVFLKPDEFILLPGSNTDALTECLLSIRKWVIDILKKYIPGNKECGLAEALLIGYKDDLDKSLVHSYSNTGVVHVIAISGLHLGLIYSLLKFFCIPFKKKPAGKWVAPLVIISGLWLFSLLAGASPSVLRSAVMFTSVVLGEAVSRKSSILNNLAASAFFLLCFDPYWLWDLGFILSYGALLGIVIFMKPLYNLFAFKNKIADVIWKLNAVTLSAQVLTLPVLIYYFKQFPNLFLFTNFLVIPLSGIILTGVIILCTVYYYSTIAAFMGNCISSLIKMMNAIVEFFDSFPFSSTRGIEINFFQVVVLYVIIGFAAAWLMARYRPGLHAALIMAIIFFVAEALKIWQ